MFLVRRVIVILILIIFALNLRVPGISISKHSIKIVGPEERVNLDEDADTIVFHRLPGSDTLQIFKRRGKIILLLNDTAEETVTIRHSPFTFSPSDTLSIPAENIKIYRGTWIQVTRRKSAVEPELFPQGGKIYRS